MRRFMGLLGVVVFLLLGFWLTRVFAPLGTILLVIVLALAVVDLSATVWGWWRSRAAYTLLAIGHDGDPLAIAVAAGQETDRACSQAMATHNPIRRWCLFRDEMMWFFTWHRARRQWLAKPDLTQVAHDLSRRVRWTGKHP